jgi:hypothetical protein
MNNPFRNNIEDLRRGGAQVREIPAVTATRKSTRRGKFVIVPLDEDWGYRVVTAAGRGAGIVLHTLYVQRMTGKGDVAVTATVLQRCGIDRKLRTRTIERLVKAGYATVRYRGNKYQGCPLLTLHPNMKRESKSPGRPCQNDPLGGSK